MDEADFEDLAARIKEEVADQLPEELSRLNYKENAIADFIRGRIRRKIYNATDIKPVTFFHMYVMGGKSVGEIETPEEEAGVKVLADN